MEPISCVHAGVWPAVPAQAVRWCTGVHAHTPALARTHACTQGGGGGRAAPQGGGAARAGLRLPRRQHRLLRDQPRIQQQPQRLVAGKRGAGARSALHCALCVCAAAVQWNAACTCSGAQQPGREALGGLAATARLVCACTFPMHACRCGKGCILPLPPLQYRVYTAWRGAKCRGAALMMGGGLPAPLHPPCSLRLLI